MKRSRRMKPRRAGSRSLLIVAGAVGCAVLAVSAWASSPKSDSAKNGSSATCKKLRLITWEGYADPSFIKPFEKKFGVDVTATYVTSLEQLFTKLVSGGTKLYDITTSASDDRKRTVDAGLTQPIDTTRIKTWNQLYPFLKPIYKLRGKYWAVPQNWGINPFLYTTAEFKNPPASWNVLWDPKLKGKVGLWRDYSVVYIGASVLGYDKNPKQLGNLSDAQLDAIKKKMLTLKPQVRKVWQSGGDLIQLFAQGELSASLGWQYIYQQLRLKKFPIRQTIFKDHGSHGWMEGLALSKNLKPECTDLAYDYLNYITTPKVQAQMAKVTGYGVAHPGATKYMSKALIEVGLMDKPYKYAKGMIIKTDVARLDKYLKTAEEIFAGLQ